jgi:site-specific DNA recombinase
MLDFFLSPQIYAVIPFPDGITYDFENHCYRTPRVNQLFAAIPLLTRKLVEKNKATSISFDDLSLLVARTRLERATFGL